ncbi:hypothetical protein [Diaminobutyricimonas sp. TR449]|uniref:hypothetical protein n=1 Tax=Diaminobutyricimonas sp. TR449 TaxID=2708076 RepID=UPI0014231ADC|nr:hypothetical protein [Diaminobutyricimonas sp. TR449]
MSERLSLVLFAVLAGVYGIAATVTAVTAFIEVVGGTEATVTLSTEYPVPPDAAVGTATVLSGNFDSATVVVSALDWLSRAFLGGGILVTALMHLTIAATIVYLCLGLVRGRPFARPMTWLLATTSNVLILGGLIGAGLTIAGQFSIASQLDPDPAETVFPMAGYADLAPLVVGVALAAAAAAFELGERLQRDTEGLV